MRTAIYNVIAGYDKVFGNSMLVTLFLLALLAIYCIDLNDENTKRRRINPTVFLLSIWIGISYAFILVLRKCKDKLSWTLSFIFMIFTVLISGKLVFWPEQLKESVYLKGNVLNIVISVVLIIVFLGIQGFTLYKLTKMDSPGGCKDFWAGMIILVVLHFCAGFSDFIIENSLILNPLSIGSIVLYGILPGALLGIVTVAEKKENIQVNEEYRENDEFYQEEWDFMKHKYLNIKTITALMLIIFLGCLSAVFVLNSKINSLYDATLALEEAAENKAAVYEFIPEGETKSVAEIVVSGSGYVTVYGGGKETYGEGLYEFIGKKVPNVNKWVLYGTDEDNKGAYDYCARNGLSVDEIFVMDLKPLD